MLSSSTILGVLAGFVPLVFAAPVDIAARGGSISVVDACHQQYGNDWAAAYSGTGRDDWYCENVVSRRTGGLNFDSYCNRTYGCNSIAFNSGGLYDWHCT